MKENQESGEPPRPMYKLVPGRSAQTSKTAAESLKMRIEKQLSEFTAYPW